MENLDNPSSMAVPAADPLSIVSSGSSTSLRIRAASAFKPLVPPARYKGAWGGRGSGKSHFFAQLLIARCLRDTVRVVCVREIQKSLEQSVKRLIEDKIQASGLSHRFNPTKAHIEVDNGGIIIFQGMQTHTADSIKSLEGYDIAWIEEAQSVSLRSLDLLRPTIRKPGSELWFSWNPDLPTDPVDKLLRGPNRPPDSAVVQVNYTHNRRLPDVLREELEWDKRRDPDKFAHIWLGDYRRNSEARVFRNWRIDTLELPPGLRPHYGADWGFSVDPTVLVKVYVIPNTRTLYIEREVYKVGCDIDHTPALFDRLDGGQARNWPITADSARPETISYMWRHGYSGIRPAKKGPGSVEDGIEFMRSHDIVVHPDCRHTIDELTLYAYKTDPLTGEVLPVLEDKDNNVIDACRYAVESMRRGPSQAVFGSY